MNKYGFLTSVVAMLCMPSVSSAAGFVDRLDTSTLSGWACNTSGNAQWVHFFDGGTYIGSTTSNTVNRSDAASLCSGNKWVGFEMETPRLSAGTHTIRAYVNDSVYASTESLLAGPTELYIPSADFAGPSPFGVVETITPTNATGWACDPDGDAAVNLNLHVQYDRQGDRVPLVSGTTNEVRYLVPQCAGGLARGFDIPLPAMRGGTHNIIVTAKNIGPGSDRALEEYQPHVRRLTVPFAPSLNADPQLLRLGGCWFFDHSWQDGSGCAGMAPWQLNVSTTVRIGFKPKPQLGYMGPQQRYRFDGLANGAVLKFETYDKNFEMDPWDYNFQAITATQNEISLTDSTSLKLQIGLRVRQDFNYTDPMISPTSIETGNTPWINLIVAGVFRHKTTHKEYYLEAAPFVRGVFPAPDEIYIGGPAQQRNARLYLNHLGTSVSLPSQMLVGEARLITIDFRPALQATFAGENPPQWGDLIFTGAYVGTEQFGKHKFALDVTRFSVFH